MTNTQIQIILRLLKAAQSLAAQLTEALAQLRRYVQSLLDTAQPTETERRWTFPKDTYTVLAIWLLYDPIAHELFPVNKKKSWAELANRLTKYIGWVVDEHSLRRNYNRRKRKNAKLGQVDPKKS